VVKLQRERKRGTFPYRNDFFQDWSQTVGEGLVWDEYQMQIEKGDSTKDKLLAKSINFVGDFVGGCCLLVADMRSKISENLLNSKIWLPFQTTEKIIEKSKEELMSLKKEFSSKEK
jgi:hypothetical protein